MIKNDLQMLWGTIRKVFTYTGRASRKEYWTFILACVIGNFILGIFCGGLAAMADVLGMIAAFLMCLIIIAEIVVSISLTVRRLHDVNLSGFWLLYLNPFLGLPLIYVIYLLGVDASCERFVENVKKVGSPWLGWILLWLLWTIGSFGAMFLLCLCAGKNEANEFGESPYSK